MSPELMIIARQLRGDYPLCSDEMMLELGPCTLCLRSNSSELLNVLKAYFSHVLTTRAAVAGSVPDIEVIAIQREVLSLGVEFIDWKREPGKAGRKDAYHDLAGGRLVHKVRSGMLFLQSETQRIACGPCLQYDNQVINFINTQYMNWLQQDGYLICHAAGMVHAGHGFAIAGFSGGGKSTLMLHLLDDRAVDYLSNDRLFIRRQEGRVEAVGIPKLPRVNPGTILHNAKLLNLITEKQRESLLALAPQVLWELEDKYDVDVEEVYGAGRILQQAPLSDFLVLNWQRDSQDRLEVIKVDLEQRRELLAAIMKSPGPFYQYPDGRFYQDSEKMDEQAYLDALQGVTIHEVKGQIDFQGLKQICLQELMV